MAPTTEAKRLRTLISILQGANETLNTQLMDALKCETFDASTFEQLSIESLCATATKLDELRRKVKIELRNKKGNKTAGDTKPRAPYRCSLCRQTGHNKRNCVDVPVYPLSLLSQYI
jgi:hypothetical protein